MINQTIKIAIILFTLPAFTLGVIAQAESVKVPVTQQGATELKASLPKTGVSKANVKAQLGDPITIRGPFGEPPITTWTYSEFTVYFEYDHVIHAVINVKKR